MNILALRLVILSILFVSVLNKIDGKETLIKPVTPNASPEAVALLDLISGISGKYILTGQHNYPNIHGRNSIFAADYIGKTPVVYSIDWGFEKDGNTDSYLARPNIVKEAIEHHKNGGIVTICWHAVPPTADEPVTFRPLPDSKEDSLASIQGQLTDKQFQDVLTPGTLLYKRWCSQVDSIAKYLKLLQEAKVPILWRPYHEMNGSWFWWGGRQGKYSTVALYKQLFDRLVKYHKINNLVWVWNIDRPSNENMQFRNFYPGNKYLDILSIDIYGNDFKKEYYDSLLVLSNGKPLLFGEVGNPPAPEIMAQQPLWTLYVVWAGMVRNTTKKEYDRISQDQRYLYFEDTSYISIISGYRKACKLKPLTKGHLETANFSGFWLFNEEKSELGNTGASSLPYILDIKQYENSIEIYKTILHEYAESQVDTLKLSLDGKELHTEFWHSPVITTANWLPNKDTLSIQSKITVLRDGQKTEFITDEKWHIENYNKYLIISHMSNSFWGKRNIKMVFERIFH